MGPGEDPEDGAEVFEGCLFPPAGRTGAKDSGFERIDGGGGAVELHELIGIKEAAVGFVRFAGEGIERGAAFIDIEIAMPISTLHQVSVVLRDGQFNPLPVPLNDKQRVKAHERVAEQRTTRKMKSRLKHARKINPEVPESKRDGQVIDGQATRKRNKL